MPSAVGLISSHFRRLCSNVVHSYKTLVASTSSLDFKLDFDNILELGLAFQNSNPNPKCYRTRAIISRGLYIFYSIFKYNFFVFKEVFSENSVLIHGLYSRAASNQERLMMARVR